MSRDNEGTEAEYLESQSDEGAYDDERRDHITCKYCGESALHWVQYYGKWRLFDCDGNSHSCFIN